MVTDQTSAHDPLNGYVPGGYDAAAGCGSAPLRESDPDAYVRNTRSAIDGSPIADAMVDLYRSRMLR